MTFGGVAAVLLLLSFLVPWYVEAEVPGGYPGGTFSRSYYVTGISTAAPYLGPPPSGNSTLLGAPVSERYSDAGLTHAGVLYGSIGVLVGAAAALALASMLLASRAPRAERSGVAAALLVIALCLAAGAVALLAADETVATCADSLQVAIAVPDVPAQGTVPAGAGIPDSSATTCAEVEHCFGFATCTSPGVGSQTTLAGSSNNGGSYFWGPSYGWYLAIGASILLAASVAFALRAASGAGPAERSSPVVEGGNPMARSGAADARRLARRRRPVLAGAIVGGVAVAGVVIVGFAAWAAPIAPSLASLGSCGGTPYFGGIGTPGAQPTVTVGTDPGAYQLSQHAASMYERNSTCGVVISVDLAAAGVALSAACAREIDFAAITGPALVPGGSFGGCSPTTTIAQVAGDADIAIAATTNPVTSWLDGLGSGAPFGAQGISYVQVSAGEITWTDDATGSVHQEPLFSFNASTLLAIYAASSVNGDGNSLVGPIAGYTLPVDAPWLGVPGHSCAVGLGQCFAWGQVPFPAGCGTVVAGVVQPSCVRLANATHGIEARDLAGPGAAPAGFSGAMLDIGGCGLPGNLSGCGIATITAPSESAMLNLTEADPFGLGYDDLEAVGTAGSSLVAAAFAGAGQPTAIAATTSNVEAGWMSPDADAGVYAAWFPIELVAAGEPTPTGFAGGFLDLFLNATTDSVLCAQDGVLPVE